MPLSSVIAVQVTRKFMWTFMSQSLQGTITHLFMLERMSGTHKNTVQ